MGSLLAKRSMTRAYCGSLSSTLRLKCDSAALVDNRHSTRIERETRKESLGETRAFSRPLSLCFCCNDFEIDRRRRHGRAVCFGPSQRQRSEDEKL